MSEDIAKRDQNYVPTMQGVSSLDGLTPTDVHVDPITNEVLVKTNQPLPTEQGNNPSVTVTETTLGDEITTVIEKVVGSTTYTKTIVENTATGVTTISAWS